MTKKIVIHIRALTKKNHISIRELSRLSDIRHATLSELSTGKRQNINFNHIEKIAECLNITDLREIIDLVDTNE
ncbi:MAG: helix-turn-helix transcriptional regulator [Paenibacillaceae bacterium]